MNLKDKLTEKREEILTTEIPIILFLALSL